MKRGSIAYWGVFALMVITLVSMIIVFAVNKVESFDHRVGFWSMRLLNTYEEGEKIDFYLEKISELKFASVVNDTNDLTLVLGQCEIYEGVPLLNTPSGSCLTDNEELKHNIVGSFELLESDLDYPLPLPSIGFETEYNAENKQLLLRSPEYLTLSMTEEAYQVGKLPKEQDTVVPAEQPTLQQVSYSEENPYSGLYCSGADMTRLSQSILSNCAQPHYENAVEYDKMELINRYLAVHGMNYYDPLLVAGQFHAESGCSHPASNGQGIGQVVSCAQGGVSVCSIEENIDRAIGNHLRPAIDTLVSQGITDPIVQFKLTQFAYNRGSGSLAKAIEFFADEGMGVEQAMAQACYYYYDQGAFGNPCEQYGRDWCCLDPGGAGYANMVYSRYETACSQLGGIITLDGAPVPISPITVSRDPTSWEMEIPDELKQGTFIGIYYLDPSQRLQTNTDLDRVFSEFDYIPTLIQEALETCFDDYTCALEVESTICINDSGLVESCSDSTIGGVIHCDPTNSENSHLQLNAYDQYVCQGVFNQPVCLNENEMEQTCSEVGDLLSCKNSLTYRQCVQEVLDRENWHLDSCDGPLLTDDDPSQIIKFCVDTGESVKLYDETENTFGKNPILLRFALTIHSTALGSP